MSGRTIGAKPRPRALIVGFDDQTADRISKLFPTVRKFEKLEDLEHTHLDEWDLVVLNSDGFGNLPQHIYVVGFGANGVGRAEVERSQYSVDFVVSHDAESLAQEFQVPGGLHPDLKSLVERDLLPLVRGRNRNAVVTETATYSSRPRKPRRRLAHAVPRDD